MLQTPNLDALAARSVVFDNAYVQSPQCQPSRASYLTGKYPTAHQVWWNHCPLAARHGTLPLFLPDYHHAWFGKLDVMRRGLFRRCWTYEDWRRNADPEANWDVDRVMRTPTWTGRFEADRSLHHEDQATALAIDHVRTSPSPWFVGVSYYGPHPPYAAPYPYNQMYNPQAVPISRAIREGRIQGNDMGYVPTVAEWQRTIAQYYGQVSWIDDNIGQLLAAVPRDTVVVFASDHGDILGDHGLFSKGIYAYEGNTRVPMMMTLPNFAPQIYGGLVQAIDLVPTLLDLTGHPLPRGLQGKSLLPVLSGYDRNEFALSFIGRTDRLRMIRWANYKYWVVADREYLFDLAADPSEEVNITTPTLVSEARFRLLRALISAEDPLPYPVRV